MHGGGEYISRKVLPSIDMDKKYMIIVGLVFVAVLGGVIYAQGNWGAGQQSTQASPPQPKGAPAVTVIYTDDGYLPNEVSIKRGDIVEFRNESDTFFWPASDIHPTHTIYPAFDPLRPIESGNSWSFRFEEAGTWRFHDHIQSHRVGTITVLE